MRTDLAKKKRSSTRSYQKKFHDIKSHTRENMLVSSVETKDNYSSQWYYLPMLKCITYIYMYPCCLLFSLFVMVFLLREKIYLGNELYAKQEACGLIFFLLTNACWY